MTRPGGAGGAFDHRPIRRTSAAAKLVALVAFAFAVVALPRHWIAVYAAMLLLLIFLLAAARVPLGQVLRRLLIDVPFVVFAVLLPFVATGPRIEVAGLLISEDGLWAAWGMLAKIVLCTLAAILVAGTTEPRRLVLALESLGMPRELTSIMAFMLRYLSVIADDAERMRIARLSRGFVARGPASWRALARSIAALFVRAHARGERVHLARLSRGLVN